MDLDTLGIDPSVSTLFPPEVLIDRLSDLSVETVAIDEQESTPGACGSVVTFAHREWFHEVEWVHSVQAGIDHFPHESFREAGVVLTNSTGIHGDAIGETVAGYVLALSRRLWLAPKD